MFKCCCGLNTSEFWCDKQECPFSIYDKRNKERDIENIKISKIKFLSHKEDLYKLYLAVCLLYGERIAKNERKAVSILKKLVQRGYIPANYFLSICYFDGIGVEKQQEEAVELCKKAAEKRCNRAEAKLYFCYRDGIGVKKDFDEAVYWCARAVTDRCEEMYYEYANICCQKDSKYRDLAAACRYYEMIIDNGDTSVAEKLQDLRNEYAEKCYMDAERYYSDKNIEGACYCYETALKYGHPYAYNKLVELHKNHLEECYREKWLSPILGNSWSCDIAKGDFCCNNPYAPNARIALKFYKEALLKLHQNNYDTKKINKKIKNCYEIIRLESEENKKLQSDDSIDLTNAVTQYELGYRYYFGNGVEQNYDEAFKWFLLSAEQGYDAAQDVIGDFYYYGDGVEQNYGEAVKWYMLSTEREYALAQCHLGNCYYYGKGVKQDYVVAEKWYRLSAEQGNAVAQNLLGDCYYYGRGIEQNYTEAIKLYHQSAENNNKSAMRKLQEINMPIKQKWLNSNASYAISAAELLNNVRKENLGTFPALGIFRSEDVAKESTTFPAERTVMFKLYKIYDFNDPTKTFRQESESQYSKIEKSGAQISFVVVPMKYVGKDSTNIVFNYEKRNDADESDYVDVFNAELIVLARDYPVDISTLAEAEFLRQENEFHRNYFVQRTDGTFVPPNIRYYETLKNNVLKEYFPEECN